MLNNLDNWLILAQSRELVCRHRLNTQESVPTPSQRTIFLGVQLDSVSMQACLAPAQVYDVRECLCLFKIQARPSCFGGHMSQAPGSHGSGFSCTRAASHEAISVVDEAQRSSTLVACPPPTECVAQLLSCPPDIAGPSLPVAGGQDGHCFSSHASDYNGHLLDPMHHQPMN